MLRLLFILLLFAGLTYGSLWLAERPGDVVIDWQGYEITMQLGILVAMTLCAGIAIMTIVLLLKGVFDTPKRLRNKHQLRHYEKAIAALNHTMTALALGDHREAERQLNRSRYHLKSDQPVTKLLGVQLAHANGKEASARSTIDAMLEEKETRPVALRGKIRELMREGQWVHARDYAEEAFAGRPNDHWSAMVLLDIVMRERDWDEASKVIDRGVRKKALTRAQAHHYRAMLYQARAQHAQQEAQHAKAQPLAELALKTQPDLLAAHLLLAKSLAEQGDMKRLRTQLSQSWSKQPHPALAKLFLENCTDVPAAKIQKRLAQLISKQEEHPESLLLRARVAIDLGDYDGARNALKSALSVSPSPRIYSLFAELERAEHNDEKQASQWLSQALNAPRDASWHCSHCNAHHEAWQTHCASCGQFDAVIWTHPDESAGGEPLSIQADAEEEKSA